MEVLMILGVFIFFIVIMALYFRDIDKEDKPKTNKDEKISPVAKVLRSARISALASELLHDLILMQSEDKAKILIMINYLRLGLLSEESTKSFGEILTSPDSYSIEECYELYWELESIYLNHQAQVQQIKKNIKPISPTSKEPPDPTTHLYWKLSERFYATEISSKCWLVTLGAVIVPNCFETVKEIWTEIKYGTPYLQEALDKIKEEDKTIQPNNEISFYETLKKEGAFIPPTFR